MQRKHINCVKYMHKHLSVGVLPLLEDLWVQKGVSTLNTQAYLDKLYLLMNLKMYSIQIVRNIYQYHHCYADPVTNHTLFSLNWYFTLSWTVHKIIQNKFINVHDFSSDAFLW